MYFSPAKYSHVPGWDFVILPFFLLKELDAEGSEVSVSRISAPTVLRVVRRVMFGFWFYILWLKLRIEWKL